MRLKLLTLCMALCCLCLHATSQNVPDYVPSDGLVAWYPFNGNANDESGFENDGIVVGATLTFDRFGVAGSAYNFDGNDHIEAQHQDWLNMGTGSDTWSGWGKKTSGNDHAHFLTKIEATSSPYIATTRYLRYGPNENIEFAESQWGTGSNSVNVYTTELLNEWVHLVGVKDSISGTMRIYKNGILMGESEIQNEQSFDHSGSLFIGCEHPYFSLPSGPQYFFGDLDDLGIWNRALTEEEILALYNAPAPTPGCTDSLACNFNAEANNEDGSCVYPLFGEDCETGAAACGEGTVWDASIQACVPTESTCPDDLDGDGVIGVNDLMQLLSSFGTDCPEPGEPESAEWACGDPVNYDGYDYATVQIGEQCWFAENGRFLPHVSPPDLGSEDDGEAHAYVYGYIGADPTEAKQSIQYQEAGALYNQKAVMEWNLCPSGWHVPDANEVISLSNLFGGIGSSGGALKTTGTVQAGDGVWNAPNTAATNASGFSAIPGGSRNFNEVFVGWSSYGNWRTTTPENGEDVPWHFCLAFFDGNLSNNCSPPSIQGREGYSVRCVKDSE